MPKFNQHNGMFAILLAGSLLVFWEPLATLLKFALGSEQYSHILLIPFVTVTLLYQERDRVFSTFQNHWHAGGAFVAGGAILYGLGLRYGSELSPNDQNAWAVFSIVVIWLGFFLMVYGVAAFRAGMFPLLFLFFLVPLPEALLDSVIVILQRTSAEATDILFRLTPIPVYRDGMVFALPNVAIQVAKECSGIRSSMALFITSLLAGYLFLKTGWKRAVLCAAVLPITIFKNGLRIVTLSALAVYVDPAVLDSTAHRRGGIPFFGLSLLVLGVVLWFLRRGEPASPPEPPRTGSPAAPSAAPGVLQ